MTISQQHTPEAGARTEPAKTGWARTAGTTHWGPWALGAAFAALAWAVLATIVPALGWLSGLAVLAGAAAYAMMATNLFLSIRRPVLERLFGPLDRVYSAHRVIGTGILAVLGLHLVLIPIASLADRHQSILAHLTVALPLGVIGALLLIASVVLAVNTKVPYDRWQKVHLATGVAFVVLTGHMLAAAGLWSSLTSPMGAVLDAFALLGIASFGTRIAARVRAGIPYVVAQTIPRERGLEIVLQPAGPRRIATHRPGQFAFLTATAGGAAEAHPFTLTSPAGDGQISVLIRPSGDWTTKAQADLTAGDQVLLEGPFGGFTPRTGPAAPRSQVWIAGGAGITPFLSVLRTAGRDNDHQSPARELRGPGAAGAAPGLPYGPDIELILAARDAKDVPCWDELTELARAIPGITITTAFSDHGGRIGSKDIEEMASSKPAGTHWYVCGPAGLADMVERTLKHQADGGTVHRELYEWRSAGKAVRR